jgi:hypothetical protein
MLCEKCGQQEASFNLGYSLPDGDLEQHFCFDCGAVILAQERWVPTLTPEQQSNRLVRGVVQMIQKDFLLPRLSLLQSNQVRIHGRSIWPPDMLVLFAVSSLLPDVDAMEILLGSSAAGNDHVVKPMGQWEVHIVRWSADPELFVNRIFEPFPNAGAQVDLENGILSVGGQSGLFPSPQKSLAFCNLAAIQLNSAGVITGRKIQYRAQS